MRITVAVLAGVLLLFVGAAIWLRQPSLTTIPYPWKIRSDPAELRRHVVFLTTSVVPRDSDHPANLDAAAAYIAAAFQRYGGRVEQQTFAARGATYRNVIAHYGRAGGTRPLLIDGAHYDAFGSGIALPGADDNASGTAGLLELARLLEHQAPQGPVALVAYSTEEPPFFGSLQMGSAVHAASVASSGRAVKGMISLEMIGCFSGIQTWDSPLLGLIYGDSPEFIGVTGGQPDRPLIRTVKRAMRGARGVDVLSFAGPREMLDASDQRNYWIRGWTAIMITDTAFLRNPRYHTIGDTAGTLDYERMSRVVDGTFNAVLTLARE
jgi:hypothetical protein